MSVEKRLYLFGVPRIEVAGKPLDLGNRRALALLSYLAQTAKPHGRDLLATLLWPEASQRDARGNLRRTLYVISQSLGKDIITTSSDTVALNAAGGLYTDTVAFTALTGGALPSSACDVASLRQACEVYTGDFMAGYHLPGSNDFEDWQSFEREELRRRLAAVLEHLCRLYDEAADYDHAIGAARRWLSLDRTNEAAHRALIRLYNLTGQRAAAVRQYDECTTVLLDEIGANPQPETRGALEAEPPGLSQPQPSAANRPAAPSPPPIRYVRNGDVHLAYQVFGRGRDILVINGFVSHLELYWEEPGLAEFLRSLGEIGRVITFDKRGMGLSDRIGYPPMLEHTVSDALAVLDAIGSESAVIMGISEGGPAGAYAAATHPERVDGLIIYGSMAKGLRAHDYPWALRLDQHDAWLERLVASWGGPSDIEAFAPTAADKPAFQTWWARLLRQATSPGGVRGVLQALRDIDVRPVLSSIRIPSVVIHRTGDRAIRVGAGRHLAERIPSAEYVELPGRDHWIWLGETKPILDTIRSFVDGLEPRDALETRLATILAVHCRADRADGLSPIVEREVVRAGGTVTAPCEGKWFASIDGPSRAIACGRAILDASEASECRTRAALHTGECEFAGQIPQGLTPELADRIAANTPPGELTTSATVRNLVTSRSVAFDEHSAFRLDDEHLVFRVIR